MAPKPMQPRLPDLQALVESSWYRTMSVEERLALVRNMVNSRADEVAALRQRLLAWVKTGA